MKEKSYSLHGSGEAEQVTAPQRKEAGTGRKQDHPLRVVPEAAVTQVELTIKLHHHTIQILFYLFHREWELLGPSYGSE